jgi:hypothetical protein
MTSKCDKPRMKYQRLDKALPDAGWKDMNLAEVHYKLGLYYDKPGAVMEEVLDNGQEVQTPWAIYRAIEVKEEGCEAGST